MNHIRHSGIFNARQLSVSLIGAGGIGAMTAVTLAKMGVGDLVIYDDDLVSEVNIPTQFHRLATVDEPKVEALCQTIQLFADDTRLYPMQERVTSEIEIGGYIVISAVDSILARKAIWQAVRAGNACWYLDARMAAEEAHLFAIHLKNPADVEWYDRRISGEDDSQVPELPCTSKATFFCSATIAGLIGATVRKILTGIQPPRYLVQNLVSNIFITLQSS